MNSPTGLEFEYMSGRLAVRATSEADFGQRVAFAKFIGEFVQKNPVSALLIDLRETKGPSTFMERYQLGELAAEYLPKVPVAILMREAQTDKQLIGKLVARNRGLELEVFFESEIAEAWLQKRTPRKP